MLGLKGSSVSLLALLVLPNCVALVPLMLVCKQVHGSAIQACVSSLAASLIVKQKIRVMQLAVMSICSFSLPHVAHGPNVGVRCMQVQH